MDQEIMDILDEEAIALKDRKEELEARLSEYRDLRENAAVIYEDLMGEEAGGEEDPDLAMDDVREIQDELQERFPRGVDASGIGSDGSGTGGEGIGGMIPGDLGALINRIDSIREKGTAAHIKEWADQLKNSLRDYLDLIDAMIDAAESDLNTLESERVRFEALRLILTDKGDEI